MNRTLFLSGIFAIAIFLLACTPRPSATPVPSKVTDAMPGKTEKQSWETAWDNTLQAARKEGSVVIYCTGYSSTLKEFIPLLKQRYGINLETTVTARGAEIVTKLGMERNRGLFLADIVIVGTEPLFSLKDKGFLDLFEPALLTPEVIDPGVWYGGKLPWNGKEKYIFSFMAFPEANVGVNTQMVKSDEIRSFQDLLQPKWNDKIIIGDPTVGTGFASFSSLLYNKLVDVDFFRQLVKNQHMLTRDMRLQTDWLAQGKYAISLFPGTGFWTQYEKAGAPIDLVSMKEGAFLSPGSGNITLINQAPHPNAARIFINWLLSKEGQGLVQNIRMEQSAREDISISTLESSGGIRIRKKGQKYFSKASDDQTWQQTEQSRYLEMAKQIFEPLLK